MGEMRGTPQRQGHARHCNDHACVMATPVTGSYLASGRLSRVTRERSALSSPPSPLRTRECIPMQSRKASAGQKVGPMATTDAKETHEETWAAWLVLVGVLSLPTHHRRSFVHPQTIPADSAISGSKQSSMQPARCPTHAHGCLQAYLPARPVKHAPSTRLTFSRRSGWTLSVNLMSAVYISTTLSGGISV